VLLQQPRLRVARDATGEWNLAALAPASATRSAPAGGAAAAFALAVRELKVADGTVLFSDAAVKPPFAATLRAVELGVRSFSTAPNAAATVELSLATDADETLRETGELTFAPLAAHGTVEVAGLPLRRYAAYYRDPVAFEVRDGVLGLSTATPDPEAATAGRSRTWRPHCARCACTVPESAATSSPSPRRC
jgi:hypothetical protein